MLLIIPTCYHSMQLPFFISLWSYHHSTLNLMSSYTSSYLSSFPLSIPSCAPSHHYYLLFCCQNILYPVLVSLIHCSAFELPQPVVQPITPIIPIIQYYTGKFQACSASMIPILLMLHTRQEIHCMGLYHTGPKCYDFPIISIILFIFIHFVTSSTPLSSTLTHSYFTDIILYQQYIYNQILACTL